METNCPRGRRFIWKLVWQNVSETKNPSDALPCSLWSSYNNYLCWAYCTPWWCCRCSKLCSRSCNSRGVVIMYTNAYNVAQSCILQHFLTLWGLTGLPNVTAAVSMLVAVHITVAVALFWKSPALAHVTASCITCINTGPCVQIKVACTHSTMHLVNNACILWFPYIIFHWTINKITIHIYIEHSFQLKLQLAGITVGITKANAKALSIRDTTEGILLTTPTHTFR